MIRPAEAESIAKRRPPHGLDALDRRRFLEIAAMAIASSHFASSSRAAAQVAPSARLSVEGNLPELKGAVGWLNSPPLMAADLYGKVVVVDFWTYTCINWRRTLPYVRAWAEKYKDAGLTVIGVHTPEFSFEKNPNNVRWATKNMQIDYPVAIDSDQKIWNAFSNEYWPALYFVDVKGHIRHHQFGEGDYGRSELVIQQLLTDAGVFGFDRRLVAVHATGAEVASDWSDLRSPESYVGYERERDLTSHGGLTWNKPRVYAVPSNVSLNHWALSGDWTAPSD
jgi:thiol-disulfide isomerase/thioredoxin